MNGKIRTITRRSYGFHSASNLIALIFLCCSGIPCCRYSSSSDQDGGDVRSLRPASIQSRPIQPTGSHPLSSKDCCALDSLKGALIGSPDGG